VAQWVQCPTLGLGSGHDLLGGETELQGGLCTQWGVCLEILSLCPFLLSGLCTLSLSKINEIFKNYGKEYL